MQDDQDNLFETLGKYIAKVLRKLTRGVDREVSDLQLPGSDTSSEETTSTPAQSLELPTRSPPPDELTGATQPFTFTTLDPPQRIPLKASEPPHPDVVQPKPFLESAPATADRPLELPTAPHPEPERAQPLARPATPPQLPEFSQIDMRRGFSADDPSGIIDLRHEQMAQVKRYDQMTDMLFDAQVQKERIDRDYKDRMYRWAQRTSKDANNDLRRIEELEVALECSRETTTDVNI